MGIGSGGRIASCRIASRTSTFQNAIATLTLGFSPSSVSSCHGHARRWRALSKSARGSDALPTCLPSAVMLRIMRPVVEESEVTVAVSSDAMVACPALRA